MKTKNQKPILNVSEIKVSKCRAWLILEFAQFKSLIQVSDIEAAVKATDKEVTDANEQLMNQAFEREETKKAIELLQSVLDQKNVKLNVKSLAPLLLEPVKKAA